VFVPTPDYNGPVNPVTFTVTDNAGAVSAGQASPLPTSPR
jgi:hypothetical protein